MILRSRAALRRFCYGGTGSGVAHLEEELRAIESSGGHAVSSGEYGRLLQLCGKLGALDQGRRLHARILDSGLARNLFLGIHLVSMYGKCGSLEEACREFESMHTRNAFCWAAIMSAHAHNGRPTAVVRLFKQMVDEGSAAADKVVFTIVLNACSSLCSLADGTWIHGLVRSASLESDPLVGNSLVDLYGKCGRLQDAAAVFERINQRNLACWTSMIAAFARAGELGEAWKRYEKMQLEGLRPDKVTFLMLLQPPHQGDRSSCLSYEQASKLHRDIVECEVPVEGSIGSGLVKVYAGLGRAEEAELVFEDMPSRDVVAWNSIISAEGHRSGHVQALLLVSRMRAEGVKQDTETYVAVLRAFKSKETLEEARLLHQAMAREGRDAAAASDLVLMYGRCGSLEHAVGAFESSLAAAAATAPWNAMLEVFAEAGQGWKAYKLFKWLLFHRIKPDGRTFIAVFNACARLGLSEEARIVQSCFQEQWVATEAQELQRQRVEEALINMLVKCDMLVKARRVFNSGGGGGASRSAASWNLIMGALVQSRHRWEQVQAIRMWRKMQVEGIKGSTAATFVAALHGCAKLQSLADGRAVHECLLDFEGQQRDAVVSNALINMYSRCSHSSDPAAALRAKKKCKLKAKHT